MNTAELTKEELIVVEAHLRGEFEMWNATDEQRETLTRVIERAKALLEELEAYDEMGDSLIEWYYNKSK